MSELSTDRPLVFSVIEDDGINVTIEISEGDYQRDLAELLKRLGDFICSQATWLKVGGKEGSS